MKNKKIKISSKIALSLALLAMTLLFLFPQILFAVDTVKNNSNEEKQKVKVYLSEPLGAGEEVFHVTKCTKTVRKSPLRCTKINAFSESYGTQCFNDKNDLVEGKQIQECLADAKATRGTGSKTKTDIANCKDPKVKDSKVLVPLFGQAWGLVKCPGGQEGHIDEKCSVISTTAAERAEDALKEFRAEQEFKLATQRQVVQIFEIGTDEENKQACSEGDFYVKDKGYVDKSGTLTTWPEELGDECKTKNNLMFGSAEDMKKSLITCTRGERITSASGTGLLSEFIGAIYRWAAGIGGIIAVLVIVISGIQISIAGGAGENIDKAKTRIKDSIIALVILFLSGLILYTINPTFFT